MTTGVLLHYYGSPPALTDASEFYRSIIYRQPTSAQVERLIELYRAYGRPGPLGATVERIRILLQDRLNERDRSNRRDRSMEEQSGHPARLKPSGGERFIVRQYGKHSPMHLDDVVSEMLAEGVSRFVSLPLTPFGSRLGTENYHRAVRLALEAAGETVPVVPVDRWYDDKLFIRACALRLGQALRWLPPELREVSTVVFTTHSMPRGERQAGLSLHEQYKRWAQLTVEAVETGVFGAIEATGATDGTTIDWKLSYRSAPGDDDKWLGPDVLDIIKEVAESGNKALIVCPLPTLIENVEVFEEAGTDAQSVARLLGLEFVRTELLNDSADMLDLLEALVMDAIV